MVTVSECAMTTNVNDIEHIESESYTGVAVIRIYFHPRVKIEVALIADRRDHANHHSRPSADCALRGSTKPVSI